MAVRFVLDREGIAALHEYLDEALAPGVVALPQPRPASASRTLPVSASGVNGFWMKHVPAQEPRAARSPRRGSRT